MYQMMIVDDEEIIRTHLSFILDWESFEIHIAGILKNGEAALRLAREQKIDIALLDINMPNMNGLDLARLLQEINPGIALLIVTGYSEFNYAKTALTLGACDYILKPIDRADVTKGVQRALTMLSKTSNAQALMQKAFCRDILLNELEFSQEELKEQAALCGLTFSHNIFAVASVEIAPSSSPNADAILHRCCCDIAAQAFVISDGAQKYAVILEVDSSDLLMDKLNALPKHLLQNDIQMVAIGVSECKPELVNLRYCYLEAVVAREQKLVQGTGKIFDYATVCARTSEASYFSIREYDDFLMLLRKEDKGKIQEYLYHVFRHASDHCVPAELVMVHCISLLSLCLSSLQENDINPALVFGELFDPYTLLCGVSSIRELTTIVGDLAIVSIDYCHQHRKTKDSTRIKKIKQYIHDNLSNPALDIAYLANKVYINAGYMRAIFKKQEGMTISAYIAQERMNLAKVLIKSGKYRLSDVAAQCGFSDAGYFSKSFKKAVGVNPSEYESSCAE